MADAVSKTGRSAEFTEGNRPEPFPDADREILDYAKNMKRFQYMNYSEAFENFGITPTHFYQRLNRIIDDPRAAEYDPHAVKRFQAVRDQGRRRMTGTDQ